jgi:iron complex outermembrane receptor protein
MKLRNTLAVAAPALCLVMAPLYAQQAAPAKPKPQPQATALEPVVVTAAADAAPDNTVYKQDTATTATRLDTPLRDVPQVVNVIPKQIIKDRGITRVAEVADNVPGVQTQSGYGGLSSGSYFIRGFNGSTTFLDGFRKDSFLAPMDVQGIERVEFLKGPASVLYGQGQPGGIVNFVSKRPVSERLAEVSATYGSFDFYRATADFGGTLLSRQVRATSEIPAGDGSGKSPKSPVPTTIIGDASESILSYRLNGAYENADSFRDYNESESFYIAPSLKWDISSGTSLTLFGEYQSYDYTFDRGLLPVPQTFQVPTSRFIGDPDNHADTDTWRAGYEFIHHLNADWKFRSAFTASQSEQRSLFAQPGDLDTDGRTVLRTDTRRHERAYDYTLQNEISGKFHTGSIEHNALLGVELSYAKFEYDLAFGADSTIDLFDPVYNHTLSKIPHVPWEGTNNRALGVYLQDQVTITDQIKLLAGLRYDYVKSEEEYSTTFKHNDEAFSPRIGLVYQPIEPVSIFGGWTRSFTPNYGASKSGGGFDPEEGEQFEAGVKLDIVKNRLSSTMAVYDITKKNVLATDPSDTNYSILTGEQKSKGFEFDVVGTPVDGWNIIASYGYTDAYVSEDTFIPNGTRLAAVPENQAGLWTSYEIQSGPMKGFGIGAGVYYTDDREATMPGNGVTLPSYWRVDASVFYKRENWSAQVNFKNITDEDIYQSQGYLIVPDAPFNVQATLTYRF